MVLGQEPLLIFHVFDYERIHRQSPSSYFHDILPMVSYEKASTSKNATVDLDRVHVILSITNIYNLLMSCGIPTYPISLAELIFSIEASKSFDGLFHLCSGSS